MAEITATKPANLSNYDIAQYAERIARHHDVYDANGYADLQSLLSSLGGSITYADSAESLVVNGPGDFVVRLPHFTSNARDRFTIAHELGHYFLHYRLPKVEGPRRYGRGQRNRAETEANVFASTLLMPAKEFKKVWSRSDGDEWKVARHFEVSPLAATVRAEVLGLA
ncbi:ImmA/IrrE family metallo-endopeptidase [Cellulomonas sp. ACRRI]|uniref:ImmA/IrrE family metallo-endopeptidase n=1 Tax=Cellulomonas sp. ACRRI TaxID=2918188 RepID=UPI001EF1B46D|nr:ImmA/IrrE family metallo-endopeptidase [Cellulomonas sp. ACRRI]MCG7284798.1 ImmA/IrrE family metallo-endopeptidase [Cellulomonas sp. ACRRI]